MSKGTRRRFSPEYEEQSVAWLSEPGATLGGVATELGIRPTPLKTWRLELEGAGSATAIATQQAAAAELAQLCRDNKRLKEEVKVLRKASAFEALWRPADPVEPGAELKHRGFRVSKRTVAKLMQEKGLHPPRGRRRVPITTDSQHSHAIAPNLLEQKFGAATPDTVWLADISYIPTVEGWLYLAAVKDLATMESFFSSLKTELVHRTRFTTRREARAALFAYIETFYNRQRRYSSIGYRTPAEARIDITVAQAA